MRLRGNDGEFPSPVKWVEPAVADLQWWPGTESNCRHGDFQSPALPTELPGHQVLREAAY